MAILHPPFACHHLVPPCILRLALSTSCNSLQNKLEETEKASTDTSRRLEELLQENARLREGLSVAQAERRMLDDKIARTDAQAQQQTADLRRQLDASEGRVAAAEGHFEEARALKVKREEELAEVRPYLATCIRHFLRMSPPKCQKLRVVPNVAGSVGASDSASRKEHASGPVLTSTQNHQGMCTANPSTNSTTVHHGDLTHVHFPR
jgi:septal ring factor EnvC (AmiA/AmiB activator)